MKKNAKIAYGIIAVIIIGASFYGGTLYGKSQAAPAFQGGNGNFSGRGFNRTGMPNASSGARSGSAGFIAGQIVSKDDKSISVELRDGGSKIVFFSPSTEIQKMASASSSDLAGGANVVVNGSANPDGSITAQSIQIRPEGFPRGTPGASPSAR
jgi:hypothetical protein